MVSTPTDPGLVTSSAAVALLNPVADAGRAAELRRPVAAWLSRHAPGVSLLVPDSILEARAMLTILAPRTRVVLIGGDGTVSAMLPALLKGGLKVGLVPAGRHNLLARTLGLDELTWSQALVFALGGSERRCGLHHALAGNGRGHRGLLGGAAARFNQRGPGLLQRGPGFGVRQAKQQRARLDAVAFAHPHVQHRGRDFRTNVHARRRIQPSGGNHRLHDAGTHHRHQLHGGAAPAGQQRGSGHGQYQQGSNAPFDKRFHSRQA